MASKSILLVVLFSFGPVANLLAQSPGRESPIRPYPGIKTWFDRSLSQAQTNDQRLQLFRQTVQQGRRSGGPMLRRMFADFNSTSFSLPSTTPGLATNVRSLASNSRNVVTGSARTLRYAMSLSDSGRFDAVALNRPRRATAGATDADIVFRHKLTGVQVRMEARDASLAWQHANRASIRSEMLKIAHDAQANGELHVWASRQNVLPELREFAEQHGIRVEERLRTGNSNTRPGDRRFSDFTNNLDGEILERAKFAAVRGNARGRQGPNSALSSILASNGDAKTCTGRLSEYFRRGEHGVATVAGMGAQTTASTRRMKTIPSLTSNSHLMSASRWAGRAGIAGTVAAEGYAMTQYLSGKSTERQFWRGQASLCGSVGGGAVGGFVGLQSGALAGGAIGSFFGPGGTAIGAGVGGTLGALGGSLGGAYAGDVAGEWAAESLYKWHDAEQHERYCRFLVRHFASP